MWIGRYLLILSAISLITMPVTQHLWTWDHFLHGGQDFELTTLIILTFLCLVLVLSKDSRSMDSLFARRRLFEFQLTDDVSGSTPSYGALSIFRIEPVAGSPSGIYSIPLQI
jgi:hypothetical protein